MLLLLSTSFVQRLIRNGSRVPVNYSMIPQHWSKDQYELHTYMLQTNTANQRSGTIQMLQLSRHANSVLLCLNKLVLIVCTLLNFPRSKTLYDYI